jgi:phage replication initiation protein
LCEDIILYDWLSFTTKRSDPFYIADLLGMGHVPWETIKGARGYKDRLYFNCISIHFNGRDDMGTWCELSGQGCRAFETLSTLENKWEDLFSDILISKMNITRLDVAYDDHTGTLDIDEIIQDTRKKEYVSKSDYWEIVESSKGQTVQFGSPQSDTLIRIYDKARERNCPAGEHWVRCELHLRRERAVAFMNLGLSIGQSYCGVMVNYLRFVDSMDGDSNKWRWPIKPYWGEFLCYANAISIYQSPGLEYNLDRCQRYVINQAGNAIDAYIKIIGVDSFLKELKQRPTMRNPKYDRLVSEYQALSI